VVLEQTRLVESWRSKRWDSLRVIAPNWSVALPGLPYQGDDPDGFMARDEVVTYLEGYAASFGAPVREGSRVVAVEAATGGGFMVRTDDGSIAAKHVVLATGALQRPNVPADAEIPADVAQIIGADYRHPGALPAKGVLIVGSGETGAQIAEELAGAGRDVWLSGGRSWWVPRRYRGRDIAAWFRITGWLDRRTADLPPGKRTGQSNPQLTGAGGGHDISWHTLARRGVRLLGRSRGFREGKAYFDDDLAENLVWGDALARNYVATVERAIRTRRGPARRSAPSGGSSTRPRRARPGRARSRSGPDRDRAVGDRLPARLLVGRPTLSRSGRASTPAAGRDGCRGPVRAGPRLATFGSVRPVRRDR
jgi:putative flavoprotein involved in K+ transport